MVIPINILRLRHAWPENPGFEISHESGRSDYLFIHFHTPVTLTMHGKTEELRPHACIVFHKDTALHFKSKAELIHDWMHFEGEVPGLIGKYGLSFDTVYYPKTYDFITDVIRSLEAEYFSRKSYFADMQSAKLCELFVKLARSTVLEESGEIIPHGVRKRFIDLRTEVFATLSREWTVEEMAKRVLLSESRFYVLYRDIFGITPKNDLICARVELAKNLLRRGIYSVDEVAEAVGYNSTFNFIRQFRKACGTTPGSYKKNESE